MTFLWPVFAMQNCCGTDQDKAHEISDAETSSVGHILSVRFWSPEFREPKKPEYHP